MTNQATYEDVLKARDTILYLVPDAVVEVMGVCGHEEPSEDDGEDILAWFAVEGRDNVPEWLARWDEHGPMGRVAYDMVVAISTAYNTLQTLPRSPRPLTVDEIAAVGTVQRMLATARSHLATLRAPRS